MFKLRIFLTVLLNVSLPLLRRISHPDKYGMLNLPFYAVVSISLGPFYFAALKNTCTSGRMGERGSK